MKLKIISGISLLLAILIYSCQNDQELMYIRYYTAGKIVYQNRCQNCHGENGQGLSALIPPLTDTAYLTKNKHQLACTVKNGLKDMLLINGKPFEGAMPANDIPPVEIAEVLTYVTNSFGNKAGTITSQHVADDLKACK